MDDIVSRCPICGARVNAPVGTPTPAHQGEGGTAQCEGVGRPSD